MDESKSDRISFTQINSRFDLFLCLKATNGCNILQTPILLSHLENDHDVSAYSGGRCLSSRAQLLCFSHVQKGIPGLTHKGCVLLHVSLGALSDVMVVTVVIGAVFTHNNQYSTLNTRINTPMQKCHTSDN